MKQENETKTWKINPEWIKKSVQSVQKQGKCDKKAICNNYIFL